MAQQQGSNVVIIHQTEQYFGIVPSNADAMVLPFVSESLRQSRNLISSKTIRSGRQPSMPVRGNTDVAGDINVELAPQHGKLIHHALGQYTAVSGAGMFTHTFKVGLLPTPGLCIEKQFTDLATSRYFQYSGVRVNSFKMSFASEGFIESSFSLMGKKETVAVSSFDASPDNLSHSPFENFSAIITDGGSQLAVCSKLDITIENNLDGNNYVIDGTGQRYSIPAGTAKVSGTLTALFDDVTLYNKAVNYTESVLTVTLTRGTGAGTSGNEKMTITIPELVYKPQAPVVLGPQGVLVELPFEAFYDNASEATVAQIVILSTTSYYG